MGKDAAALRNEFHARLGQMARELGRELYPDGLPRGTKFSELEAIAGALGDEMARQLVEVHVRGQAEDWPEDELGECPLCGGAARKAPDGLRRDFTPPSRPDVRWCGDLTEIPTEEGKLQLAAVLDLHSRRCVGFAMGVHHDAELARAALCVAIAIRGGAVAGVLFHTDQGGEYTGNLFVHACRSAGITQSMGRTGSALDNAVSESFNSTLEFELLSRHHFATREQARRAVAAFIDEYNTDRRHSTNGMLSPVDYERECATQRATEQGMQGHRARSAA